MKGNLKFALTVVLVVLAGVWIHLHFSSSAGDVDESGGSGRTKKLKIADAGKGDAAGRAARRAERRQRPDGTLVEERQREKERPSLEDMDEKEMTALQKSVLRELQAALDDDDLPRMRKAIAKFRAPKDKGGLGGEVPKALRRHAVSSLGWFGGGAVTDLMEFMADADPEVEEMAFEQFELALNDWELSDYERADVLKTIMSAMHDEDRITMLLMSLNMMRHSVRGNTIISILGSGTEEARSALSQQVEFFTDFDVYTTADVSKWMTEHPDDAWDDDFYGKKPE
jgi:hypothetical protein